MNEQLLQQILEKLNKIETEQQSIKSEQQSIKAEMTSRFDTVDASLSLIKNSLQNLEKNQPEDIMAMLRTINNKLEDRDNEMLAMNRRLFRVEGVIEGISKQ